MNENNALGSICNLLSVANQLTGKNLNLVKENKNIDFSILENFIGQSLPQLLKDFINCCSDLELQDGEVISTSDYNFSNIFLNIDNHEYYLDGLLGENYLEIPDLDITDLPKRVLFFYDYKLKEMAFLDLTVQSENPKVFKTGNIVQNLESFLLEIIYEWICSDSNEEDRRKITNNINLENFQSTK